MPRPVCVVSFILAALCFTYSFSAFTGELEGMVLDPTGKPVAHAFVAATPHQQQLTADGEIMRHLIQTDANGHFLTGDLPADSYGVTATSPDFGPAFLGKVAVPATGKVDNQVLKLSATAIAIEGTVRASATAPPASIVVGAARIDEFDGDVFYTKVENGRYRLNLAPGEYAMGAKAPGWSSSSAHKIITPLNPSIHIDFGLALENGTDQALSSEILEMQRADEEVRLNTISHHDDAASLKMMATVDASNEARLKEILGQHGWPGIDLIGAQAVNALWLLVQHAKPGVIKTYLPDMKAAADRGELPWENVALSIDRDLMNDKKNQLYGSQVVSHANGKVELYPVEDEAHLDERRAKIGLGPIAEYKREILKMYEPSPNQ